jgi:serine/threonine-protein kinase
MPAPLEETLPDATGQTPFLGERRRRSAAGKTQASIDACNLVTIPTANEARARLSPTERAFYELVARRYVVQDTNLVARYDLGEVLGQGGSGIVFSARDKFADRVVALKTLWGAAAADSASRASFLVEARTAAFLEHPNVIPVYDIGVLAAGPPYFTMRVVETRSLADLFQNPSRREQWPLARLLGLYVQLARALAYAHSRGVVHRDVKPHNILVGTFGEVYLTDWGIAIRVEAGAYGRAGGESEGFVSSSLEGTPGYMAPEQCTQGEDMTIDARSDVFALGVVLYELLTGSHPFGRGDPLEVIRRTCEDAPPRPREVAPNCPLLLEELCLKMLAKDKGERPQSADHVATEIEAFLEGAKERERRRAEAHALCEDARDPIVRYQQLETERERLTELARQTLTQVKGWEPVERKRAGWAFEDRAAEAERESGRALAEAIELYTHALGYDAECVDAHRGLADLYWRNARRAESDRQPAAQAYYEALVTDHDLGNYASLLRAPATLSIATNPPGATAILYRYAQRDRVLVPTHERYLGRTPIRDVRLDPGSYVVILKAAGYRDVRYPVLLARGGHHAGEVNLYTNDELGEDFVYVPGGPAIVGGDADAIEPLPRQEVAVPDFAIARFPVTMRDYCAFLDSLTLADAALAEKRAPHDLRGSEGCFVHRDSGRWEPKAIIIEGDARKTFPEGKGHEWNVPAVLVDWFDAVAFCHWRGACDGVAVRLPTEVEWEKAARGADGRFFPWGDHFDATFCHMRESRPYAQQPEPVGTFTTDESPYGARDMAGGVREWVGDAFGERTFEELSSEAEPTPDTARGKSTFRRVRSGSWNADNKWSRAASRGVGQFALTRGTGLGFRVAKTLTRRER